jgi:predicted dehydrogenase
MESKRESQREPQREPKRVSKRRGKLAERRSAEEKGAEGTRGARFVGRGREKASAAPADQREENGETAALDRSGSTDDAVQRPADSSDHGSVERSRPLRFAVVGLGHIAQAAVLPAFAHAKRHAELAALVTHDRAKLAELGKRYKVAALYDYQDLRRCLREESIDAIYIATPNSEHRELALEAAACGVHVLCEKPLAVTEGECIDMIRACERAGVLLMTAYRLHFEAASLKALEAIRAGTIGDPRIFTSAFSFQISDPDNIRLKRDLGGGPLHDIGIYCINAARSIFRSEPIEVQGWTLNSGDPRFREIDETVSAQLRFPNDRIATFTCSYATAATGWYQIVGTKGDIRVDPAYEYSEGLETKVTIGEKRRSHHHPKRDQFAAELVYFVRCIHEGLEPEPSGWEGLADVRVIRAIQQSIERGVSLELPPSRHVRHPTPGQRVDRPPVAREPKIINARSPSQ